MTFFEGNAVWHILKQSDAMTVMVLTVLFVLSVLCWAVFFGKWLRIRAKKRELTVLIRSLNKLSNADEMLVCATQTQQGIGGDLLVGTVQFMTVLESQQTASNKAKQWLVLDNYLEQTLDETIARQESYLPFLSTTASVATLLGLFGTVWGLIHAFVRMSEHQSTDIATVAPGIAEALIATLAGLAVAIPALVMYNYLACQTRAVQDMLARIADKVSCFARQRFEA